MQQSSKIKPKSFSVLFLSMIVITLVVEIFLSTLGEKLNIPETLLLIISELIIIIPGLIWMLIYNASFTGTLGFKKIKVGTAFMTVLLAELLMPLISLVNIISQLFTTNEVVNMSGELLDMNPLVLILLAGIYGPFCEEFVFRGIIAKGMSECGSAIASAIISGLFFGLMHMNLNQFCYAFVLGVIFAIVNHASKSIWTSVIMHVVVNVQNMLLLLIVDAVSGEAIGSAAETLESVKTTDMMLYMIGVYLVLAVIFTTISIPVFAFIAKNEDNEDAYKNLTVKKDGADKSWWLNVYSIIAVGICVFVIFGFEKLLAALGLM